MSESFLKHQDSLIATGKELAYGEISPQEAQEIEVLQMYKAQIMDELHDDLAAIDAGEGTIRGQGRINRDAIYDAKHDSFFVDCEGKLGMATLGDLIADVALGCEYSLSLHAVPREKAKLYAVERSKTHLNQLLNRQLALQEYDVAMQEEHETRAKHFAQAQEELNAKEKGTEAHVGKLFEQDIIHLLKEVQYDLSHMGISVQEANIVQDMDEKIDFVVQVEDRHRGVGVRETTAEPKTQSLFGIQFTINAQEDVRQKKERQIKQSKEHGLKSKVDDILLVTVPIGCGEIKAAHAQWYAQGCPPGGPSKLYAAQVKVGLLEKIMEKMGAKGTMEEKKGKMEECFNAKH